MSRETGDGATGLIRIPVVVHVLYNSSSQNIPDSQVQSQIQALNRDFRRTNPDSVNTPERFRSLASDVKIEFVLATADPMGRPTTGILRKYTAVTYWQMDDRIKFSAQGGDNAWDSRYYLNIWVGNMKSLLGYSSIPGGPAEKDGLVINVSAFGTNNVSAPFEMGRTAVHEAGHWMGLKHIWGDTYCGDDLVDDTPPQGNFTSGCPTTFRSSCNNGTTGDMYMNYMDFTFDACMNLFTNGQAQRMLAMFSSGGPRQSILSSRGLMAPWSSDTSSIPVVNQGFRFYPNPVHNQLSLEFDAEWRGQTIQLISASGNVVRQFKVQSETIQLDISAVNPGLYFIQGRRLNEKISAKFIKL